MDDKYLTNKILQSQQYTELQTLMELQITTNHTLQKQLKDQQLVQATILQELQEAKLLNTQFKE